MTVENMQTSQQAKAKTDDKPASGVTNTGTIENPGVTPMQSGQQSAAPTDDKDKEGTKDKADGNEIVPGKGTEVQGNKIGEISKDLVDKIKVYENAYSIDDATLQFITESDLSDDAKTALQESIVTLINSMGNKYIANISEKISTDLPAQLQTIFEEIQDNLQEQAEQFLNKVSADWLEQNKVAAATTYRTAIAESFMDKLHDLFVEHFVEVPEAKIDLLKESIEKVEEVEQQLAIERDKTFSLNEQIEQLQLKLIFESATKDLTMVEKERAKTLFENVEFSTVDAATERLNTILESVTTKTPVVTNSVVQPVSPGQLNESTPEVKKVDPLMEQTLKLLGNFNK